MENNFVWMRTQKRGHQCYKYKKDLMYSLWKLSLNNWITNDRVAVSLSLTIHASKHTHAYRVTARITKCMIIGSSNIKCQCWSMSTWGVMDDDPSKIYYFAFSLFLPFSSSSRNTHTIYHHTHSFTLVYIYIYIESHNVHDDDGWHASERITMTI